MGYFDDRLMQLLPQVYRLADEGDLRDFLRVFAPTLDWLKAKIDAFPVLWNLDDVPADFLPVLGALVGYPYNHTRDPESQRRQIKFRIEFYRRKGTLYSLRRVLDEQGVDAPVIENEPWEGVTQIPLDEPAHWAARFIQEIVPAGTKCAFHCRRCAAATAPDVQGTRMARMFVLVGSASVVATAPLRIALLAGARATVAMQGYCQMSLIPA